MYAKTEKLNSFHFHQTHLNQRADSAHASQRSQPNTSWTVPVVAAGATLDTQHKGTLVPALPKTAHSV